MTGTDVLILFLHLYLSFIRSKETYVSAVLCKLVILTQQDVMSHEHIFWEKKKKKRSWPARWLFSFSLMVI